MKSTFENRLDSYRRFVGKKYVTLFDSRSMKKGTVIDIEDVDVRSFDGKDCIRFKCSVNGKPDHFLEAYNFVAWIGSAIKEIEQE